MLPRHRDRAPSWHRRPAIADPRPADQALRLWDRDEVKLVVLVVMSRLALLAAGYVIRAAALDADAKPSQVDFSAASARTILEDLTTVGDPGWYATVAESGYEQVPYDGAVQHNWAFHPLWPAIWRVLWLVPDRPVTALIATTAFFAVAVLVLYRLLLADHAREVAFTACLLVIAFPGAYFAMRPGPEALFLLVIVGAFLAARRERWILAGVLGAAAALTRAQGLLLFPALLMLWWGSGRLRARDAVPLLLIPAVFAAFAAHLWLVTGNPLASVQVQAAWRNEAALPLVAIVDFLLRPRLIDWGGYDLPVLSVTAAAAAICLLVVAFWRRILPPDQLTYAALMVLVAISRETTGGMTRYLLPVFPLFAVGAVLLVARPVRQALVVAMLFAVQVVYFVAFVLGANWASN